MGARTRLFALLVAGIAVREFFAPFTGHAYDFELWIRLGYYVSKGLDPYVQHPPVPNLSFPVPDNVNWPGYPPLWPLFLALIYKLYAFTQIQNRFFYYFLIKQPMIVADLIDAWLILKLIRVHVGYDRALKAFEFWLFCPYTILISSIWGTFDQIVLLFTLLALFIISNPWKSSFFEAIGIALKLIPSIYFPLFVGVQTTLKKRVIYIGSGLALAAVFALSPFLFFPDWNFLKFEAVGSDVVNKFGFTINYWEVLNNYLIIIKHPVSSSIVFIVNVIGYVWIPMIFVATYFCVKWTRKGTRKFDQSLMLSALFITLVFFLTKSVISEQFVTYFLGFGLFDYFVVPNKLRKILFHGIWITILVELLIENVFGLTFLQAISTYYATLSNHILSGPFNYAHLILILILALIFSAFSFLYLFYLYKDVRS